MSAYIETAHPGIKRGFRPEKAQLENTGAIEQFLRNIYLDIFRPIKSFNDFSDELKLISQNLVRLEKSENLSLADEISQIRVSLVKLGPNQEIVCRIFSIIALQMKEIMDIDPYPEQYYAGWTMLQGAMGEMNTGEGKTLTIAFPAITMALTGTPVHIITVNEYLVERDAKLLYPIYRNLGLSVGLVTQNMTDSERRNAYAADIVYCSNKQVAFDYLRDYRSLGSASSGLSYKLRSLLSEGCYQPVQRGLCYAILDEVDSVLIDDARVPLILTEPGKNRSKPSTEEKVALGIARTLHEGADFTIQAENKIISLSENGIDASHKLGELLEGNMSCERYRSELIKQALAALHIYKLERDYVISDHKIVLIDENTGRTMSDRKLPYGLHRMLEIKEKCKPTDELDTVASISYQRFFLKYHLLTGLSGTLREVKSEIRDIYGIKVVKIPSHRSCLLKGFPTQCYPDRTSQLARMLTIVMERHRSGQPILIGTRSVEFSNRVSDVLTACGIQHELLNAVQDHNEAMIIEKAGSHGAVTVATNMAGRGTDIPLRGTSSSTGGLHVINLEFNESPRVDRQLYGRAARQGDPGSSQSLYSLEDDVLEHVSPAVRTCLQHIFTLVRLGPENRCWSIIIRLIQWRFERTQMKQRKANFAGHSKLKRHLAVSGQLE